MTVLRIGLSGNRFNQQVGAHNSSAKELLNPFSIVWSCSVLYLWLNVPSRERYKICDLIDLICQKLQIVHCIDRTVWKLREYSLRSA